MAFIAGFFFLIGCAATGVKCAFIYIDGATVSDVLYACLYGGLTLLSFHCLLDIKRRP